jgi:hypothetical protein
VGLGLVRRVGFVAGRRSGGRRAGPGGIVGRLSFGVSDGLLDGIVQEGLELGSVSDKALPGRCRDGKGSTTGLSTTLVCTGAGRKGGSISGRGAISSIEQGRRLGIFRAVLVVGRILFPWIKYVRRLSRRSRTIVVGGVVREHFTGIVEIDAARDVGIDVGGIFFLPRDRFRSRRHCDDALCRVDWHWDPKRCRERCKDSIV